jgi:hypothetical protein
MSGLLALNTDTLKLVLTNTLPVAANHVYSDISGAELANGNGYTTGGLTIPGTSVSVLSGNATVTLVNGSTSLVATGGTAFTATMVGMFVSIAGVMYQVATYVDPTHLTLVVPYQGSSGSATLAWFGAVLNGSSVTITSVSGGTGPFRYWVVYDSTPATKTLLAWYDYGSSVTLVNPGDNLAVQFTNNVIIPLG